MIIRLMLHSWGRPRTIRVEGCSFITRGESVWIKLSANETERFTNSWINPEVTGLPSKRHDAIRQSRGSNTKDGEAARDVSKKFEVAPESIKADTGSGRPGS